MTEILQYIMFAENKRFAFDRNVYKGNFLSDLVSIDRIACVRTYLFTLYLNPIPHVTLLFSVLW
jgi:hypothetical protein